MTLDEVIAFLEEHRAALGGQARLMLDGQAMRAVRAVEVLAATEIQPHAYANTEGLGGRWNEAVVVIKS